MVTFLLIVVFVLQRDYDSFCMVATTRGRQSGVVVRTVGYIFHGWLAPTVPIFVNRFQPDRPVT
jgi:hypothetical protein